MSEDTEEYIYAGYMCYGKDRKRGWRMVSRENPGDRDRDINVQKHNAPDYVIGDVVDVEWQDEDHITFRHGFADDRIEDGDLLDRLRARSKMNQQEYRRYLNRRKLDDDMKDIEDMTIAELKEYADKGYFNKSLIVYYILERL